METSELRKLAEEIAYKEIAYKYELTYGYGHSTDCVFIDDTINAMLSFHEQASKDTKERLKTQIDLNDKLLLELKESTQRIIELENELNELIDS